MMRSLFSGVAGLKTHQTRMDVIGNNIANVNSTAYKSQSMVFNDLLYQQTQAASGANATTGRGGINPRQIGLGAKTGAISTAITQQGSAQSTNNPWDVMIEGESFFIVSDGSQNFFTRDGSFTVDGAGNLVMSSTGFTVMGWQVDPETGEVRSDVVSALRIMSPENMRAEPEATTMAYMDGILDKTDTSINSTAGAVRTMTIYDAQGYKYTVKFSVHGTGSDDEFRIQLDDIQDENGVSLVEKYGLENIEQIAQFGSTDNNEIIQKYPIDESKVSFDETSKTYTLKKSLEEMLDGYSKNSLLVAAGNKVKVVKDNKGTEFAETDPNQDYKTTDTVYLKGSVTLTDAQLEAEPYNFIKGSDGTWYKKSNTEGALGEAITAVDWAGLLKFDGVTISSATMGEDGLKVEFLAECKPKENVSYNVKDNNFGLSLVYPTDEKAILEQVFQFEDGDGKTYSIDYIAPDGSAQIKTVENNKGNHIYFDHDTGAFSYIGSQGSDTAMLTFSDSASSLDGTNVNLSQFSDVEIDFSSVINLGNGGKCTLEMVNGSKENSTIGSGRKVGELSSVEIGQDGTITASYDNGLTKTLCKIAVAEFANASGLAKAGNNLYSTTQNSGEFDGVGVDITASGGQMTSGVLEMSNVDLSSEFTTMITTQRGFQANSRIITVSDTMLEELVNLKR